MNTTDTLMNELARLSPREAAALLIKCAPRGAPEAAAPEVAHRRAVAEAPAEYRSQYSNEHWLGEFSEHISRHLLERSLTRTLEVWGLNQSDAAKLFGVSRQAFGKWVARGVPAARLAAVADLSAATDLLTRHLKRDRIPGVVRRKADMLDGNSLIDLVATERTTEMLAACHAMFDFDQVQN